MLIKPIDPNPSRRRLAVFGLTWLVFFSIGAAVVFWKTGSWPAAAVMGSVAIVVPGVGQFRPRFMRVVYLTTNRATRPIGAAVAVILLAMIYYLLMTPIGLLMRLFGYDPMCRRFDPASESYWQPRRTGNEVERYFQQY